MPKKVAKELSFIYVDTGAMYRAMAVLSAEPGHQMETSQEASCSRHVREQIFLLNIKNGEQIVILNGENVNAMHSHRSK